MTNYIPVSIVVATYNAKQYLYTVIQSILNQTVSPLELLIADDGSSDGTDKMLLEIQKQCPFEIRHIWQEDKGFRKAAIINKALVQAKGEYIIHIDGDVILDKHFIEDHLRFAQKGYFVTGSRGQVMESLKNKIFEGKVLIPSFFSPGVRERFNVLRMPVLTSFFLDSYKKNIPYFARGCNFAFWKSDFMKVNGFNEDIPHIGTEDFEFAARLNNIGVKRHFLKFSAIQYHIYHKKRCLGTHPENRRILKEVIDNKTKRCVNGVDKYLKVPHEAFVQ